MPDPISLRIDEEDRPVLTEAAREAGIALGTFLRQIIHERARELRVAQIRRETRGVGNRAKTDAKLRAFYEEIGTPTSDV
jgi:hypothetical protein